VQIVTVSKLTFHCKVETQKQKPYSPRDYSIFSYLLQFRIGDFGSETRILLEQWMNHRIAHHSTTHFRTRPLRTLSITACFQVQCSIVSSYHSYRSLRNISGLRSAADVCIRLLLSGSDELGIAPARHLQ
jgi:hypothetical protein